MILDHVQVMIEEVSYITVVIVIGEYSVQKFYSTEFFLLSLILIKVFRVQTKIEKPDRFWKI